MNSRGQLTFGIIIAIALAALILIVGTVLGFKVIFSKGFIFYLIGGGVLVLTFIYAVPALLAGRFTREKRNFVIVLFVIGVAVVLVPLTGVVQNTAVGGPGQYIQVPLKGFYTCEPGSVTVLSPGKSLPASMTDISCPENTDKCDIIIESTEDLSGILTAPRRIRYSVAGGAFQTLELTPTNRQVKVNNVLQGQKVTAVYEIRKFPSITFKATEGASYNASYNPYILFKTSPTGGKTPYSSVEQGCRFMAKDTLSLIIRDTLGYGPGTTDALDRLDIGQTRNFIDVIIPISVENAKLQGDKYCSNSKLYRIDEVQTVSGSYKVVNTNEVVQEVECCNGDVEPGIRQCQNNKWVALPKPGQTSTIQCSAFKPCTGSDEVPYSNTQLVRSVCENGLCVQKTRTVECTVNAGCPPSKPVCDTKTFTCVATAPPIGQGTVIPANDSLSVQEECEKKDIAHPLYGYTVVKRTTEASFGSKLKYYASFGLAGTNKPTVEESCEPRNLPYMTLGVIILALGTITVLLLRKPGRKPRRR